jgi:hypothetical protein
MTAHLFSSSSLLLLLVALGTGGCSAGRAPAPQPLTEPERTAITDTLRQLYREASQTFDSELDCEVIVHRLSSVLASFVAQGRIIEAGSPEEGVRMCRMIKRDRLSAREDIQEQNVELLGRDAAVVVTRGVYTVRFRDGRTSVRAQVVTTVWSRSPDGWRNVHLHESWQNPRVTATRPDTAGK